MEPSIILCYSKADTYCDKKIVLPLSKNFSPFSGEEILNIVYQDQEYHYLLKGLEFENQITNIRLLINNKDLPINYEEGQEKGEPTIFVYPANSVSKRPFSLLYGVTDVSLCIQYDNETEEYYFSSFLAIAVQQQYAHNIDSVKDMLDNIYKKNHALLHQEKAKNDIVHPDAYRFTDNKFSEEKTLLVTIFTSLKTLLPFFLSDPHTVALPAWTVDNFEKLHTIQSKNLNFIVTHPDQLRTCQGSSGILINKQRMIPERTLVSTSQFSCNTPENQAIVSFIQTLFFHLQTRKKELSDALLNVASVRLKETPSQNYIISASVIQEYSRITLTEHLKEIEDFLSECSLILHQYIKALPCSFSILHQIPTLTHCFLEVYHYRQVYELITRWFASGDYILPSNNLILHFSSADEIYEYFCLLNLYDILVNDGFVEHTELRKKYKYDCTDSRYAQCENDNTFYFSKNDCEITLYYQPLIYSRDCPTRNGISLFRTDRSFYSPDYIIKKQTKNDIDYCILDAKWRPQEALLNRERTGGLGDLSYKYLYSVVDENTMHAVKFFWLLQGKDDGQKTYYHNVGSISKKQSLQFRYSTGIVRLSPKFGNQDLVDIIRVFLLN